MSKSKQVSFVRRGAVLGAVVLVAVCLAACGTSTVSNTQAKASGPVHGGSLTVLENSSFEGAWPEGLDPATNTSDAADFNYNDAIYGDLFQEGNGGKIVDDLATGYKYEDAGRVFEIFLRHGVKFTDGTPLNAAAVKWNISRDLEPKYGCICDAEFPISSITTVGSYTVVLHLKEAFAPLIYAFPGTAPNWIASPTALAKMGEKKFAAYPVGAGPFEVKKDVLSDELVLVRNPNYWQKGYPYLNTLTFKVVGSDESAYEALLAGEAQAYEDLSTVSMVSEARKHLTVTTIPEDLGPDIVQLNTLAKPFNNLYDREAMYYATNPEAINKALEDNLGNITQSITTPGVLFYEPKVPGYRTYNLAKAKALVQKVGGISITLGELNEESSEVIAEALKAEWSEAGINVTLDPVNLEGLIEDFETGNWQSLLQGAGGYDVAIGDGLSYRFESTGSFTGVHSTFLDSLISKAAATLSVAQETTIYHEIFYVISSEAYAPILFGLPSWNLTTKGVHGPGLTTGQFNVFWQDVWRS